MFYTRTSFLRWLRDKHCCEINPVSDQPVLILKVGNAKSFMHLTDGGKLRYLDIYSHCRKLRLPDLPGEKDLEKIV